MEGLYKTNRILAEKLYKELLNTSPEGPIIIPSAGPYRSVFAWDSGWNYFWLKELSPEAAREELTTLFRYAEPDGRVSHEVMLEPRSAYSGIRRLQLWLLKDCFDERGRAFLIDPPAYIWAALDCIAGSLSEENKDSNSFLLKGAVGMMEWLQQNRMMKELEPPFNSLPVLLHPLESGTDHSLSFDKAYGGPRRLYVKTFLLSSALKKCGWKLDEAVKKHPVFFDLTFIGLYMICLEKLESLAKTPGIEEKLDTEAFGIIKRFRVPGNLQNRFAERFYDPQRKCFASFYYKNGRICRNDVITFSSLIPFLLDGADPVPARSAIEKHALPGGSFYHGRIPDFNPREAVNAPLKTKLWRGSCSWMNMNYLLALLLEKYGYNAEAARMTAALSDCVARGGAREYFHSETLEGGGCSGFSWNGLLLPMSAATRTADGIPSE